MKLIKDVNNKDINNKEILSIGYNSPSFVIHFISLFNREIVYEMKGSKRMLAFDIVQFKMSNSSNNNNNNIEVIVADRNAGNIYKCNII